MYFEAMDCLEEEPLRGKTDKDASEYEEKKESNNCMEDGTSEESADDSVDESSDDSEDESCDDNEDDDSDESKDDNGEGSCVDSHKESVAHDSASLPPLPPALPRAVPAALPPSIQPVITVQKKGACCCGCGTDSSNINHYCIYTKKGNGLVLSP
jgi:hypothetical protein